MFLGYQENKIKYYVEQPLNPSIYNVDKWEETNEEYVLDGDEYVLKNEEWEERQAQKEKERIANLTMTALDFINFLKNVGLTDQNIEDYLNANLAVKHQLQFCQNVYCGVAKALMPIKYNGITITAEMVETAFRIKNGEGVA